ncbi:MAG: MiaB/RimO family radical SAM methylthiotransferase [Veillonella sp.]|nr:MiaB/RimO family radical SAM methylthiotransferase [Veillonella sp.]
MGKKLGYVSLGCAKNLVDTEVMLGLLRDELFQEIPEIDALIGTGAWDQVMVAVDAIEHGNRSCIMENITNIYDERMPRIQTTPRYSAYVKIAEGCNNGCTFCIIPKVRGAFRSRTIESIKVEVERLAATGVKEVVLIAQDTTSYGIDLNNGKPLLTTLLKELTTVEGIEWIRMLYLYPTFFSDELLDIIVNEPKLCKYVDIPLQHVNNDILKQMNRRDDRNDIERLLKKIRNAPTHITLRTSIIVGFPGETDEQFEELCDFVKEIKFDNMGVFTYSQEAGTPAGAREDQIPEDLEGTIDYAMVEEIEEGENNTLLAKGRLKSQAPDVDGNMYIEDCGEDIQPGDILKVQVEQGFAYDVVATVVE